MRSECISAAQFVARMKRKYQVNPVWVWDLLEEEYNIIKGLGCVVLREEAEEIEYIIRKEVA